MLKYYVIICMKNWDCIKVKIDYTPHFTFSQVSIAAFIQLFNDKDVCKVRKKKFAFFLFPGMLN